MRKTLVISSFFFILALILAQPLRAQTSVLTPVPTESQSLTPTLEEEIVGTEVIDEAFVTPTPSPTPTPTLITEPQNSESTQFKELIFIAIICLLILIIVLQVYLGGGVKEENPK
jgi:hypothetical protein